MRGRDIIEHLVERRIRRSRGIARAGRGRSLRLVSRRRRNSGSRQSQDGLAARVRQTCSKPRTTPALGPCRPAFAAFRGTLPPSARAPACTSCGAGPAGAAKAAAPYPANSRRAPRKTRRLMEVRLARALRRLVRPDRSDVPRELEWNRRQCRHRAADQQRGTWRGGEQCVEHQHARLCPPGGQPADPECRRRADGRRSRQHPARLRPVPQSGNAVGQRHRRPVRHPVQPVRPAQWPSGRAGRQPVPGHRPHQPGLCLRHRVPVADRQRQPHRGDERPQTTWPPISPMCRPPSVRCRTRSTIRRSTRCRPPTA